LEEIDSLKKELNNERKINLLNKNYILILEKKIFELNRVNNENNEKIKKLEEINKNNLTEIRTHIEKIKILNKTVNDLNKNNQIKQYNKELEDNIKVLISKNKLQEENIKHLMIENENLKKSLNQ